MAQHIRTSRMIVIPDVGHDPQFEKPEELFGAIDEFLARPPKTTSGPRWWWLALASGFRFNPTVTDGEQDALSGNCSANPDR